MTCWSVLVLRVIQRACACPLVPEYPSVLKAAPDLMTGFWPAGLASVGRIPRWLVSISLQPAGGQTG